VLAVAGGVFALVYLAAVWLLGVPDEDERASLRRRLVRLHRRTQEGVRAAHPLS